MRLSPGSDYTMRHRIPLPLAGLAITSALAGVLLILLLPRIAYIHQASAAYQEGLERWQAGDHTSYTITILSNSRTQHTGGTNTLRVENGRVVEAHNPNCPTCQESDFTALTVEALFTRIEAECLHDFPIQFCSVAYDDTFGYPVRIDTYPHLRGGEERPSITVWDIQTHGNR
jgi:hypothetical protein